MRAVCTVVYPQRQTIFSKLLLLLNLLDFFPPRLYLKIVKIMNNYQGCLDLNDFSSEKVVHEVGSLTKIVE